MKHTGRGLVPLSLVVLVACGDGFDTGKPSGGTGGVGAGSSSSSGDLGGAFGAAAGGQSAGSGDGSGGACAGETSTPELSPLDMYIMLDSSGSMSDRTGTDGLGPTKWDAVRQALSAFFGDPKSAGLGVGLQHFPAPGDQAPATCGSNQACGDYGPCMLRACTGLSTVYPCIDDTDCESAPGSTCVALGSCGGHACVPADGSACADNQLPCEPLASSVCIGNDSCDPAAYAAPAVEIAALGAAATELDAAMSAMFPWGNTPTGPAIQGAVDHARAWAAAHPGHTPVAVLATDGFPTECSPWTIDEIAALAAAGLEGTPKVPTFVIGVFAAADVGAQDNLDAIAAAGGTGTAFLVDVGQDVTQAFIDALTAIRGVSLACEYQIPMPSNGAEPDYGQVNVEHTPPGATAPDTVPYVASAAGCDPVTGGWYYDVDPVTGATPSQILMCSATCSDFAAGGEVEIRVGCKTVIVPPPK